MEADTGHTTKLMRMGVMTALAIAIHNFPEGLATFVSALQDPSIAIPIVVAIAHSQHSRGHRGLGSHLSRHRLQGQGLSVLLPLPAWPSLWAPSLGGCSSCPL